MATESPPAAFIAWEPEHGLPTPVFSSDVPEQLCLGKRFTWFLPDQQFPKLFLIAESPKIRRDVQCPCHEMSVQRSIPHLYLSSHLLCISGYKSMNRNAHRRVVAVVSEPATSKSAVTRVRLLLLKPFSSASLPCGEQTSV